jgi:hypothetical protein
VCQRDSVGSFSFARQSPFVIYNDKAQNQTYTPDVPPVVGVSIPVGVGLELALVAPESTNGPLISSSALELLLTCCPSTLVFPAGKTVQS